jgi:hypothetical protein
VKKFSPAVVTACEEVIRAFLRERDKVTPSDLDDLIGGFDATTFLMAKWNKSPFEAAFSAMRERQEILGENHPQTGWTYWLAPSSTSTLTFHHQLDRILAHYLTHHPDKVPSTTSALELLEWSHKQKSKELS